MALEVTNAKEITKNASTYLLYGAPGLGKTSTLKYLEGDVLLIDIDHTSQVLQGMDNIDVLKFNSHDAWNSWQELMKDLAKEDLSKYDTIAFDNISELTHSMLGNMGRLGKNNRVPEMRHYQQVDFFIIDSIRFMKSLGKRIVLFAWESTDTWETQEGQLFNRAYPDVRDKIRSNIMGLSDVVGRLVYNPKTEKRGYILQPSDELFAKNQLSADKFMLQKDIFKVERVASLDEEAED